eukprot:scaffold57088_cov26-Tisochrysis_lutea.AAC.2
MCFVVVGAVPHPRVCKECHHSMRVPMKQVLGKEERQQNVRAAGWKLAVEAPSKARVTRAAKIGSWAPSH